MGLFTDGFKLLKKASEPLYKTPQSYFEVIRFVLGMLVTVVLVSISSIFNKQA